MKGELNKCTSRLVYFNYLMRIELLLKQLSIHKIDSKTKVAIKIHVDDYLNIESSEEMGVDGLYCFMQRNIIEIERVTPRYFLFEIVVDGAMVAKKSLFCDDALERKEVNLNPIKPGDKNTYDLTYELKILEVSKSSDGFDQLLPRKGKKHSLQQQQLPLGQKGEFKVFEIGKLTYNFAKRIDPLIKATYKGKDILFWKNPEETIGIGIIISLLVYFPKISIILLSLCLIFAKGYLINLVQASLRKQDISKRLLPPEENLNFLQKVMEIYCNVFENFYSILKDDDKTTLITLVEIICKCGFVLFVISLLLSLSTLIVLGLWLVLFFTSSTGQRAIRAFWPQLLEINKNVDQIISLVSKSSVGKVLKSSSPKKIEVLKEFYIYEYQRWWVGKEWVGTHYSDEGREVVLYARTDPPFGWKWVGPWKVQKGTNTDADGFEYTNDLIKHIYTSAKYLKTIRRRRWTRVCKKEEYLGENIMVSKLLGLDDNAKAAKIGPMHISTNKLDKKLTFSEGSKQVPRSPATSKSSRAKEN